MITPKTVGFELLTDKEKKEFQRIFDNNFNKIQRKIKNISSFIFHFKEYEKDGKVKKFSINSKIIFDNKIIEASAYDWDFNKSVHKIFNKLNEEIEHKFHLEGK